MNLLFPAQNIGLLGSKMEVSVQTSVWDTVKEQTKVAVDKESDPLLWAMQLSASLNSAGVSLPAVEAAELLVSHICWRNNVPTAWKFLDKALLMRIVSPFPVLALLSTRSFFAVIVFVCMRHFVLCGSFFVVLFCVFFFWKVVGELEMVGIGFYCNYLIGLLVFVKAQQKIEF